MQLGAHFALAFATTPPLTRINLAASSNSPDHYAKGTQSGIPNSCEYGIALPPPVSSLVSGSISLPSPGFFSTFPYGTCSLSVASEYLALGDGSPDFSPGSTYQAILEDKTKEDCFVSPTRLSLSWVCHSRHFSYKTVLTSLGLRKGQRSYLVTLQTQRLQA